MFKAIKNYFMKDIMVAFTNQTEFNNQVVGVVNELVKRVEELEKTSHRHLEK